MHSLFWRVLRDLAVAISRQEHRACAVKHIPLQQLWLTHHKTPMLRICSCVRQRP